MNFRSFFNKPIPLSVCFSLLTFVVGISGSQPVYANEAASKEDRIGRIVGGKPSPSGRWPSMVALIDRGNDLFNGQFCGGTIIARRWVLTAAHCVIGVSASSVQVATGLTDLSGPATELINVSRIILHPNYNNTTLNFDFALLQLRSSTTQPVASLYDGASDLTGELSTTVGWGATNSNGTGFPTNLLEVDLPVVSNNRCENLNQDGTTPQMICAGDLSGLRDACGGDSGGPLFVNLLGRDLQVGVTSFGLGACANSETYGVWARVTSGNSFITTHVPNARLLSEEDIRGINGAISPVVYLLDQ